MIRIRKENDKIIVEYMSDQSIRWVLNEFDADKSVTISRIYTFKKENIYYEAMELESYDDLDSNDDSIEFIFGTLYNDYYKISKETLNTDVDIYISKEINIKDKFFKAVRNISIFKKINKIVHEDIYIGGERESNLPIEEFRKLISEFPNSYELSKYASARIFSIVDDYFTDTDDAKIDYEKYLNNKKSKIGMNLISEFSEYEVIKYKAVLEKLEMMLSNQDAYIEKQWQKEINQIILLLYPKYIAVFEEALVKDYQFNTSRRIDFLLVDSNGNIDIIEIKKPFDSSIVSKRTYRDNYIPKKELSGSIMQIEKYIYHLNKWGIIGERKLTEKYKDLLPPNFSISISNPSGIVIMGRDHNLSRTQLNDFELIKRKYKNVIDIITYDDLIRRLKFLIGKFEE